MGVRCIARREGESLPCTTANLVPFHQLQACHLLWGHCQFHPVSCRFPHWANYISRALAWSHLGLPTLPTRFHHGGGAFPSPRIHAAPYLHLHIGLILSPSSDPIPHRLVSRIQAGEFVEMRNLLADNISLHNQLEDFHGHIWPSTPAHLRPRLMEVPSLSSWVYCFCAYIAVLAPDARTRELLAYCRLIIREALRHGGSGWQEYDRTFCWQAAIDSSLPWNVLVPGLQAAMLLGNRGGPPGLFCALCREPEHNTGQCALSVTQQPTHPAAPPG